MNNLHRCFQHVGNKLLEHKNNKITRPIANQGQYLGTDVSPLSLDVNPIQEECGDPVCKGGHMFLVYISFVVLIHAGVMPPTSTLYGQSFMIFRCIVNPG